MVVREMSAAGSPAAPRRPSGADQPDGPNPPDGQPRPNPSDGPRRPDRWSTVLRQASLYGPLAAGYGVFQSLVGVLPESMSGTQARYFLAVSAGLATGIIVRLSAMVAARSRAEQAAEQAAGAAPAPAAAPALPPAGVYTARLVRGTARTLLETRSTVEDPAVGRLTGWSHFLEDGVPGKRPTAIGTAYGLHCVLTLAPTDGLLDTSSLVETLWRLRVPDDGGWAARTGAGVGRPEVSALVLGALARAGADPDRIAEGVAVMEALLVPDNDAEGLSRTYVVTHALRGLVRAAPRSAAIGRLRTVLLSGCLRDDERGGLLCWAHRLPGGTGRPDRTVPSAAHTAQAVVALARTARVLPDDTQSRQAREQGVRWLCEAGDLQPQTEHMHRVAHHSQQGYEHALVRHFTAAWVAKALLSADPAMLRGDERMAGLHAALLARAVGVVRERHQDGIWVWSGEDGDRRPIWMTYQGLSVLTAPELSGWEAAP